MRPIFAIDITDDKDNDRINGEEFISASSSRCACDELDEKQERLDESIKKTTLPMPLRIIEYLAGFFALMVLAAVFRTLGEVGIEVAFRNAPLLLLSGLLCGIAWLVLFILSKKKAARVVVEERIEEQADDIEENMDKLYSELGVPDSAINVDILVFRYKIKDGEIRPHTPFMASSPYVNTDVKMYADDENLYIADLEHVYKFEKASFVAISEIKKRICVPSWNKEEGPREGRFKSYKMTVNNLGDIFFKPYYVLELSGKNEPCSIYFPPYELDVFEALTGLTASASADGEDEESESFD